jgi:hypothetical protein
LIYLIFTDDTDKVIARSAEASLARLRKSNGGKIHDKPILQSTNDINGLHPDPSDLKLPRLLPESWLEGHPFILPTPENFPR